MKLAWQKRSWFWLGAVLLGLGVTGALVGCGGGKPKIDLQAQLTTIKGEDKDARINAFVALGELKEGAAPAVPALIECLKDPDADIRRLAAYVLGEIGPPAAKALPALKPLLSDDVREVMTQAVNSIRSIDPKALEPGTMK